MLCTHGTCGDHGRGQLRGNTPCALLFPTGSGVPPLSTPAFHVSSASSRPSRNSDSSISGNWGQAKYPDAASYVTRCSHRATLSSDLRLRVHDARCRVHTRAMAGKGTIMSAEAPGAVFAVPSTRTVPPSVYPPTTSHIPPVPPPRRF